MEFPEQHLEEDPRFVEVTEEYDRLSRKSDFAKGQVLCQIRDEKLFGRWGTFENTANHRLKVKPPACLLLDGCRRDIGSP